MDRLIDGQTDRQTAADEGEVCGRSSDRKQSAACAVSRGGTRASMRSAGGAGRGGTTKVSGPSLPFNGLLNHTAQRGAVTSEPPNKQPPGCPHTTSRQPPGDLWATTRPPLDNHQATSGQPPGDRHTTCNPPAYTPCLLSRQLRPQTTISREEPVFTAEYSTVRGTC